MGCASSKNSRCKHCGTSSSYPPVTRRSFSMNVVDTYHVVSLTSSTLGSIKVETPPNEGMKNHQVVGIDKKEEFANGYDHDDCNKNHHQVGMDKNDEFAMGMIEAKVWSKMIDEKISAGVAPKTPNIDEKRTATKFSPKTPIRTPPGEPETIDVHDLMQGLEETSPLRLREHVRSFSFHVTTDSVHSPVDSPEKSVQKDAPKSPNNKTCFDYYDKDHSVISEAVVSEFDPELISAFRKALQELSPTHPFHIKPNGHTQQHEEALNGQQILRNGGNVITELEVLDKKLNLSDDSSDVAINGFEDNKENVGFVAKERVVLYFTSLRGVRKTYEDCCYVRLILKSLGVRVDERDVSMHSGFKEELKARLGEGVKGNFLPKVFVGENYIGGVEEIRRMHEDGQLEKVFRDCERLEDDGGNMVSSCEACGDIRFLPCETCSGSCKIYHEYEEDDEEVEELDECGFQRCPDCNENGLIRCPVCCY